MKFLKPFIITAAIVVVPLTSYGWTKTYGYENYDDYAYCIQSTTDGGYIVSGITHGVLCWLLKTDRWGDTLWTRIYDGSGRWVQQTSGGGYILVGSLENDLWLLKADASGDSVWAKTYGEEGKDWGRCVRQTTDEGYIIVGCKDDDLPNPYEQDLWLLKTDSLGDTLWTKPYGGDDIQGKGTSVCETSDGGYIISGIAGITGESQLWLMKTDANGDSLWSKKFGKSILLFSGPYAQQTSDGGYVVVGSLEQDVAGFDFWLIKTDSTGDTLWTRSWGTLDLDMGCSVGKTTDGGYIISGVKGWYYPSGDLWLIKTDSVGDTLWTWEYGEDYVAWGYSVHQTEDGGYIIAGERNRGGPGGGDLWLLKTNEYGDTVWYEGEPREILNPQEGDTVDYMIPAAWFKNTGTYPIQDFYCHCEIWPWSGDSAACAYLSPPYHVKYWVSYEVEPGDSILIKFSEWMCDDSSRYVASFYTTKDEEPLWSTNPKTVSFQGTPYTGVIEDKPAQASPSWGLISSCGPKIILKYSNYPQGFSASIFDVAGRKVDELKSVDASGTITWGDTAPTGVYFIRISLGARSAIRKVILLR
ncbi:hypothetical protein CEE36_11550 [candidate division TA06 bacterium B3_TA06]|uniref:Secretion system C-terminal sorting domain-containing protein n=1 Tax=candidate division TA06 bacterium B3_TA06 TaxID=2012487 RepID=A0A532UNQ3_UNCT6|nr:MAG: hypothetical protein CEE36_11550 [candidate division TA06 bacterium B3_TA06]